MNELRLPIHEPTRMPEHFRRVFPFVRVSKNRAWISGHTATNPDGTMYQARARDVWCLSLCIPDPKPIKL